MSSRTHPCTTRDGDSVAVLAKWIRQVDLPLSIFAWTAVALPRARNAGLWGHLCAARPHQRVDRLIVLVYFVVVHVIEGDVVGPRIVGKAIGLHPVVSLAALVAGAELFGITGALFASPVAGVLQALLVAIWLEWRATHPKAFQRAQDDLVDKVEEVLVETPNSPEPPPKMPS